MPKVLAFLFFSSDSNFSSSANKSKRVAGTVEVRSNQFPFLLALILIKNTKKIILKSFIIRKNKKITLVVIYNL